MGQPVNWDAVWNGAMGKIVGSIVQIINLFFSLSPLPDVVDLIILLVVIFLIVRAIWRAFAGQG